MNFYNPYTNFIPYSIAPTRTGFFRNLISGLNFRSIISGTQKTLNFVNQVIPAVRQISPIVKNAKTMFKVMSEFKKPDNTSSKNTTNNKTNYYKNSNSNNLMQDDTINQKNNVPTFFL